MSACLSSPPWHLLRQILCPTTLRGPSGVRAVVRRLGCCLSPLSAPPPTARVHPGERANGRRPAQSGPASQLHWASCCCCCCSRRSPAWLACSARRRRRRRLPAPGDRHTRRKSSSKELNSTFATSKIEIYRAQRHSTPGSSCKAQSINRAQRLLPSLTSIQSAQQPRPSSRNQGTSTSGNHGHSNHRRIRPSAEEVQGKQLDPIGKAIS